MDKFQTLREIEHPENNVYPNIQPQNIPDDAISSSKIASSAVVTIKIANNAITSSKIGPNAVTSLKINPGAVGTTQLADNAVSTAKIIDNAVKTAKINDGAVTSAKILDGAVTRGKIGSRAVDKTKLSYHFTSLTEFINDNDISVYDWASLAVMIRRMLRGYYGIIISIVDDLGGNDNDAQILPVTFEVYSSDEITWRTPVDSYDIDSDASATLFLTNDAPVIYISYIS